MKTLLDSGNGGRALLIEYGEKRPETVHKFLEKHDQLRWLHEIQEDNYLATVNTLYKLQEQELESLERKKVLFVIAFIDNQKSLLPVWH